MYTTIRTLLLLASLRVFPATANAAEQSPLTCERPHIDVGETGVRQQSHEFILRNAANRTVHITGTRKACGCVVREFTKYELAPGETTKLTLDFPVRTKPGTLAGFVERLEIYADSRGDAPALVVSVGGRFVPVAYRLADGIYIEAQPKSGQMLKGTIELFLNKGRGVKVESINVTGKLAMQGRITETSSTLTEGEERLVLEVSGTLEKGTQLPGTATVLVKLNSEEMAEMSVPVTVFTKRAHEVRFSPQMLAFGVLAAGGKAKRAVTVELPKLPGYAVEKAEASGDGVSVAIEEQSKVKHVVLLRCELDASELAGKLEQDLLVTVSVPDGAPEVYKLPISGFVKPGDVKENQAAEAKR